jgi:hypothetical protein
MASSGLQLSGQDFNSEQRQSFIHPFQERKSGRDLDACQARDEDDGRNYHHSNHGTGI